MVAELLGIAVGVALLVGLLLILWIVNYMYVSAIPDNPCTDVYCFILNKPVFTRHIDIIFSIGLDVGFDKTYSSLVPLSITCITTIPNCMFQVKSFI